MKKTCSQCGKRKQKSEFGVRKASADGLTASCKKCLKARDQARYEKERDVRLARNKAYAQGPGKEKTEAAKRAWIARNQDKRAAHVILGNALRDGRIVRCPCEDCGAKKSQAHHDDYSKPLDVRWKCARCHAKHHREERGN